MKSEHTPGPYSVSGIPGDHHIMAKRGHDKITLAIVTGHPSISDGEFYANQALFAAAPDLLEACKAALASRGRLDHVPLKQLRAAIAKAQA